METPAVPGHAMGAGRTSRNDKVFEKQCLSRKVSYLLLCLPLLAPPAGADLYVGLGGGIVHTNGLALQLAMPVYRGVELHYSIWDDGEHDRAAGVGYRFENGSAVSILIGIAYIGRLTENLLRRADAYVEIRVDLSERFSCQVGHYSSVGDDKGENLLLCGVQWGWRTASAG